MVVAHCGEMRWGRHYLRVPSLRFARGDATLNYLHVLARNTCTQYLNVIPAQMLLGESVELWRSKSLGRALLNMGANLLLGGAVVMIVAYELEKVRAASYMKAAVDGCKPSSPGLVSAHEL